MLFFLEVSPKELLKKNEFSFQNTNNVAIIWKVLNWKVSHNNKDYSYKLAIIIGNTSSNHICFIIDKN